MNNLGQWGYRVTLNTYNFLGFNQFLCSYRSTRTISLLTKNQMRKTEVTPVVFCFYLGAQLTIQDCAVLALFVHDSTRITFFYLVIDRL